MTVITGSIAQGANSNAVTRFPPREVDITPSDTDFFDVAVTLEVTNAGTIAYIPSGADRASGARTRTITAAMVANGPWYLPVSIQKLLATGTSATGFRGLY